MVETLAQAFDGLYFILITKSEDIWVCGQVLGSLFALLIAAISVFFLALESLRSRRVSRANFLNEMEEMISRKGEIYKCLIENKRQGAEKQSDQEIHDAELILYLGFFEKLKLVIDQKVLTMNDADSLFAYRFFVLVHDKKVQSRILYASEYTGVFSLIFVLHKNWMAHRNSKAAKVHFHETELRGQDPVQYDKEIAMAA